MRRASVRGGTVYRARTSLRLTQREFAELLGVHPMTVSKWERKGDGWVVLPPGVFDMFEVARDVADDAADVYTAQHARIRTHLQDHGRRRALATLFAAWTEGSPS